MMITMEEEQYGEKNILMKFISYMKSIENPQKISEPDITTFKIINKHYEINVVKLSIYAVTWGRLPVQSPYS